MTLIYKLKIRMIYNIFYITIIKFCLIIENELTNIKARAIFPTRSCTDVATTTLEEHITRSSDVVVVSPNKKLSQYRL